MKKSVIAIAIIALSANLAHATYMEYEGLGLHDQIKVYAPGSPVHNQTTSAGQLRISLDDEPMLGYCVDLYQYAGDGHVQIQDYDDLNNGWMVAWLLDTYASAVDTGVEAASLQAAIWEVLVDGGNLDVNEGNFRVKNNAAVIAMANCMLAGLPDSYDPLHPPTVIHSDVKQDIIVPNGGGDVPEPATMAILAFGGLAMAGRRRK